MKNVRVSIVLPVFNAGQYLDALIDSLLCQTEASFEIIAINDGSTDDSLEILKRKAGQDGRILVLSQPNKGVAAARNLALEHVVGKWITFVDGDDWMAQDCLERRLSRAEKSGLDLLVSNGFGFAGSFDQVQTPLLHKQPWNETITGVEWIKRSVASEEWPHYVWLQLVSRDFLLKTKARFKEGIIHEDVLWTMHLALAAMRVGFESEPLYGYRNHPESMTRDVSICAVTQRSYSYLTVIEHLVNQAYQHGEDRLLRRALLIQANRESGHFLKLLRKNMLFFSMRQGLSRAFLSRNLIIPILFNANTLGDGWRALRVWLLLKIYSLGLSVDMLRNRFYRLKTS